MLAHLVLMSTFHEKHTHFRNEETASHIHYLTFPIPSPELRANVGTGASRGFLTFVQWPLHDSLLSQPQG